MWMVPVERMCDKHLLGEHVEIHMLLGSVTKRRNINGFLEKRLLEPFSIKERHDLITSEMKERGYNHNTPIEENPDISYLGDLAHTKVDINKSYSDLLERCERCRSRKTDRA